MFFLVLALVGCAQAVPSVTPTAQAIPMPTLTPTATYPSRTEKKTATAKIIVNPIQTAIETQIVSFPFVCDVNHEKMSPDGRWRVLICDRKEKPRMVVENQSGTVWELKFEDFLGPDAKENGVAVSANLIPRHWSLDGTYFYFSSYSGDEGGGICFYGFGDYGLFRLDLMTGKVSTILVLPPTESIDGYQISFSPTGRRFAYFREDLQGDHVFHLVDLRSGEEITFATEPETGSFTWSPDGEQLAYSTSLCNYKTMRLVRSLIKVLTISDLSTRTIAQSNTDFLTIEDWSAENNLLTVASFKGLSSQVVMTFFVDPDKSIVISSPTATP